MSALTVSPEEVKRLKGMGFLNNKGTDDFSARIVTVNGKVTASVAPEKIPYAHPLAGVSNEFNAVFINGDMVGELMFYGKGAGALPTGSAVVGDIITIAKSLK